MPCLLALILAAALTLAGCVMSQTAPTIPPPGPASAIPTSTPMIPTSTVTPPPPTAVDPVCVPPGPPAELSGDHEGGYPQAILDFLNQGATTAELDRALYAAGVASQPISVKGADLTGDLRDDIVVALIDPASQSVVPAGRLLVYTCQDGRFALSFDQRSGELEGAPHIWYLQDLTGHGSADLVVSFPTCGAHTCFEDVHILSWDGQALTERLEGSSADLPYPDVRVVDPDGDGAYDLVLDAGGFGSVGAGPQRGSEREWRYDPIRQVWPVAAERLKPSNYRVHVLADAESASRQGEWATALIGYQRVISDPTLEDWVDPALEQANLGAYARFKLVVLFSVMGEAAFAQTAYSELAGAYPAGTPQHGYVELAGIFLEGYEQGGAPAGCAAARAYAVAHAAALLDPLGPASFGYANPDYQPEDMCLSD